METLSSEPPPQSFPSLEAEAAFWRERAAVAEAAARDAREELEEFQVRDMYYFYRAVNLRGLL